MPSISRMRFAFGLHIMSFHEEPAGWDYKIVAKTLEEALKLISKLNKRNYDLLEKYNASLERERELKHYIDKTEGKK